LFFLHITPYTIRDLNGEQKKIKKNKRTFPIHLYSSLFISPHLPIICMFNYHHLSRDNDHHSLGKLALFQGSAWVAPTEKN